MGWKQRLAYITGSVGQELLLRHEYLVTENRLLPRGRTSILALWDAGAIGALHEDWRGQTTGMVRWTCTRRL